MHLYLQSWIYCFSLSLLRVYFSPPSSKCSLAASSKALYSFSPKSTNMIFCRGIVVLAEAEAASGEAHCWPGREGKQASKQTNQPTNQTNQPT